MSEYKFDAVRYCQANMDRMGVMPTGQAVGALIIGEINALRAENETLRNEARVYRAQCAMRDEWRDKIEGELAALRIAAGALISDVDKYYRCADIGESRDKLAALAGEG